MAINSFSRICFAIVWVREKGRSVRVMVWMSIEFSCGSVVDLKDLYHQDSSRLEKSK